MLSTRESKKAVTLETSMRIAMTPENTTLSTLNGAEIDILFTPAELEWMWIGEMTFLTIIFIFGTAGNILVIMVELENKQKYSTDYFVISMSSYGVVCSTLGSARHVMEYTPAIWNRVKSTAFCQFSWGVGYTVAIATPLLLSAIAVDRYILTCRPLTKAYDVRTGKRFAIGITVVGVVLGLPSMFAVYVDEVLLCDATSEIIDLELYTNSLVVLTFISFCIITVAYICIGRSIRKRKGQTLNNQHDTVGKDQSGSRSKVLSAWSTFRAFNKVKPFRASSENKSHNEPSQNAGHQLAANSSSSYNTQNQSATIDIGTSWDRNGSGKCKSDENGSGQPLRKNQKSELMRKTTMIMFFITVTYAVTHVPGWILCFISWNPLLIHYLMHFAALVSMVNCASNPAFFFLLSSKFRQTAKKIILRRYQYFINSV